MSARPEWARKRALALLLGVALAAGCGSVPTDEPGSPDASRVPQLLNQDAVLVRGWISGDGAGLEPVTPLAAATGMAGDTGGSLRLRGLDDRGATLFDVRFGERSLAAVAGRPGRYFVLQVPVPGGADLLAAIELDAGEGRVVSRPARWSREALIDGLSGAQGVSIESLSGARVAVSWDAERFELLQLRDPATGSVLALDRDGEVTVAAPGGALEIALSDGTRSAAAVFRIAENP